MSLRDGMKKMSKSDASDHSRINLTDDADAIAQKIRKAKTDPHPLPSEPKGLEGRPEADNLVGIYAALAGTTRAGVLAQYGNAQFSTFKSALVDLAVAKLGPIGAEMQRLVARSRHDRRRIGRRRRARAKTRARDHEGGQGYRRLRAGVEPLPDDVSRAQRSTKRSEVMRCRTGTFTNSEYRTIPDLRCTAARCTASGKRRPGRRTLNFQRNSPRIRLD